MPNTVLTACVFLFMARNSISWPDTCCSPFLPCIYFVRGRKFAVACHLFCVLLVLERCRCLYSSCHCLAFRPLLHKEACGRGTPTVSSQNVEKLPLSGGS